MKDYFNNIKQKLGFLAAIAIAAMVGSLSTAVVRAAIPNSTTGKIEGCYRNNANLISPKGNLRLIDVQGSGACNGQETAINWDKDGGGDSFGYIEVIEDPMNPGEYILDEAHSKGVEGFKLVTCATAANPENLGCPSDTVFGYCVDLSFVPKFYEDNGYGVTAVENSQEAVEDTYCGEGYDFVHTSASPLHMVFFK